MKKKKLYQVTVTVILLAAVILCITVIAQIMSRGYVTVMGHSLFRVATGSMEPAIPTGALLVSKEIEIEEIRTGDIICFRSKESNMLGQVITHRVIDILYDEEGEIYLETCGDANPSADGYYVTKHNLIGKVSYHTKEGNILAAFFSVVTSRIGFLSCVAMPVLLICGMVLKSSVRTIQKELYQAGKREISQSPKELFSEEEYEELVTKLKKEILEEVVQDVVQDVEKTGEES